MSMENEIAYIRDSVKAMNERDLDNAKTQATIVEKVSNIEKAITGIEKLSHIPAKCDLENEVTILKEQVKEMPRGMSTKKEVGIISSISGGIVAIVEALRWLVKL